MVAGGPALTGAGIAKTVPAGADSSAWSKQPNMIFILLDDLPIDDIGADNPTLKTPNIDKLVKGGTYIPRAAVTTSLCSPSRATILTGMTTRNHHVVDNTDSSEEGLTFFPSYLQKAGYQTAFIGKWHMGADSDAPRPGFDKWVSFKGQGSYLPMGDFGQKQQQMLNVDGKAVPRKDYITDELSGYEMNWLEQERDPSKPFFLYMSHKAVHGPCIPPPRYANQYKGWTYQLPASFADTPENYKDKPMWVRNQRNSWHGIDIRHATGPDSLLANRRDCDQVLSAVDDSIGRMMAYLKKSGLDKNTIIVFFSDNGSMWGAHGLVDKRNAYEESVRVPMIAYAPGLIPAGVRSPARIRNLDLAPTFLDFAGVKAPPQFEGHSVAPLLKGKVAWKDWPQDDFVYEYYWDWQYPMTPASFSIVRNDMKYIQYFGVWDIEELYDLKSDPKEMRNLIFDPAYVDVRVDLRHRLFEQLRSSAGAHNIPFTERSNRGFVFRSTNGTPPAQFPPEWELTPPAGKDFDFFTLFKESNKQ
ncbi:MAG: sulfatase [Sphingomonas sp.]|nr:sulfatase [Sphingomonas sp.]